MSAFRLNITGGAGRGYAKELGRALRRAHRILSPPLERMSLAIVGDAVMASLHQKFLGKRGATDVLTFELDHDAREHVIEGEVVVCLDEARRRCAENGVAPKNELLLYALHGMLHLCGFDDRTKSGFEAMHQTEDRILTELGIGPIFNAIRPIKVLKPRRFMGAR